MKKIGIFILTLILYVWAMWFRLKEKVFPAINKFWKNSSSQAFVIFGALFAALSLFVIVASCLEKNSEIGFYLFLGIFIFLVGLALISAGRPRWDKSLKKFTEPWDH